MWPSRNARLVEEATSSRARSVALLAASMTKASDQWRITSPASSAVDETNLKPNETNGRLPVRREDIEVWLPAALRENIEVWLPVVRREDEEVATGSAKGGYRGMATGSVKRK